MLESERSLWLRAVLWLAPAPVVISFLAYAAGLWVYPEASENSRVEGSLVIGFGTTAFFTGILLLGVMRGQWRDVSRVHRIWFLSHALGLMLLGLGMVSAVWFQAGGAIGAVGIALYLGGFVIRVAWDLARWIVRLFRSRDRARV